MIFCYICHNYFIKKDNFATLQLKIFEAFALNLEQKTGVFKTTRG
jgi:hypothetical protein